MASDVKQIKYGELEKDFFGYSLELVEEAKNNISATPDVGKSAGNTFMQAHFGHMYGTKGFCESMTNLCINTRECLKEAGAIFKDIDDRIAYSIEKEG